MLISLQNLSAVSFTLVLLISRSHSPLIPPLLLSVLFFSCKIFEYLVPFQHFLSCLFFGTMLNLLSCLFLGTILNLTLAFQI